MDLSDCCSNVCDKIEHRIIIDTLYINVINSLCEASMESRSDTVQKEKARGWVEQAC